MYPLNFVIAAEEITAQKSKMLKFREDHQKHKDDAQDALEYYRKLSVETRAKYAQITALLSEEHRTQAEDAMLTQLQTEYSAFDIWVAVVEWGQLVGRNMQQI